MKADHVARFIGVVRYACDSLIAAMRDAIPKPGSGPIVISPAAEAMLIGAERMRDGLLKMLDVREFCEAESAPVPGLLDKVRTFCSQECSWRIACSEERRTACSLGGVLGHVEDRIVEAVNEKG